MKVEIIKPYGFCVGVNLVIERLKKIVEEHSNESVFCVGQLVHNKNAINSIKKLGVKIIDKPKDEAIEIIDRGVVVFSAHGTDQKIIERAKEKGLITYDLACPFVKKSFAIIHQMIEKDYEVIYIGVKNHDESNAALSISSKIHFVTNLDDIDILNLNKDNVCVINQTTLSIIDIKDIYNKILSRYPNAKIIDEICDSTRTRQQVLVDKELNADGIIVVGDTNSNNSRSLYNIAVSKGYDTIFIEDVNGLNYNWLTNKKSIAILSGSSTQSEIVEEIYHVIKKY